MTKMLLNQLNFNFLKLILVILFVQINPAVGKEKLNLTYDNIEVFLEGNFVQGGSDLPITNPPCTKLPSRKTSILSYVRFNFSFPKAGLI